MPLPASAFCAPSLPQGRCSRENCKYLHPPPHLKTQLEINGRNNLIQQKNMAMLAQQMQLANAMMPGAPLQPVVCAWGRGSECWRGVAVGAHGRQELMGKSSAGLHVFVLLNSSLAQNYVVSLANVILFFITYFLILRM